MYKNKKYIILSSVDWDTHKQLHHALTKHLVYQVRNPEVSSPLNRYTCEVLASSTPHTYTSETNAILYNCHNALGYHIDDFEKNSGDPLLAARLVYNR